MCALTTPTMAQSAWNPKRAWNQLGAADSESQAVKPMSVIALLKTISHAHALPTDGGLGWA